MITKKEFFFIRHGQTDYNLSMVKVDHDDISLNNHGFRQAERIMPVISKLPIKTVCCSPLIRAKETRDIITSGLIIDSYELPGLGECTTQIWNDMTADPNALATPHEHVQGFFRRTIDGVNQALSCKGPVLIVSHGGIHWTLCCMLGITNYNWYIDNCVPAHFFVDAKGQWQARTLV